MYLPDSLNVNTYFLDSNTILYGESVPFLKVMNKNSWSDNMKTQLKKNINFQVIQNQQLNDILPNHLIISYEKPSFTEIHKNHQKTFDWFFISFILLLVFLAIIKLQSQKIFSLSLKSMLNAKYASALSREGDFFKTRAFVFIIVYTCFGLGLLAYAFAGSYIPISFELLKIVFALISLTIILLIKVFFVYLTGILFNMKNLVAKYIQQIILMDYYIAVFLFPLAFVYHYFPWQEIIYISSIILIIVLLFRIIKGFLIFNAKFYFYENFLYFCTMEILPLLLVVKFLVNQI
jgi:hypothetical protein